MEGVMVNNKHPHQPHKISIVALEAALLVRFSDPLSTVFSVTFYHGRNAFPEAAAFPIVGGLYCLRLRLPFQTLKPPQGISHCSWAPLVTLPSVLTPTSSSPTASSLHEPPRRNWRHRQAPILRWTTASSIRFLNISSSPYGLRGGSSASNLTSEEFSDRVVDVKETSVHNFAILLLMCFGERMDEQTTREIEDVQKNFLVFSTKRLGVFTLVPKLLSNSNRPTVEAKWGQETVHIFIRGFSPRHQSGREGGRRLCDEEVLKYCTPELLTAGTDTTATALQWTMARIVDQRSVRQAC
ncbi:hypothetical protein HPP92_008723 [Vanilla planifolia]|uniref:Uncharacterized protein n=1 Tax=Vanilla planifolia TaxID=51239 RepID=A0A835RA62_VANPL|nr:hypothetical protein HPP92_008723 [Vanilla planifolia]